MATFLSGRKTYLLAVLVDVAVLILVFAHRLTPDTAFAIALFAMAGFGATFRAALQRHHDEAMQVLAEVAAAGAALASHNVAALGAAGVRALTDGAKLAGECNQEAKG